MPQQIVETLVRAEKRVPDTFASPQALAEYLRKEQPERWERFHASQPEILIIDDDPRTAQRLAKSLDALYGDNIGIQTDPTEALRSIQSAQERGYPLPALIILDLHMPQMSGTRLMKELGAYCPAVVLNTASMMSPVLADICLQMDKYRSDRAMQLVQDHALDRRPANVPLAPVFINLKDETARLGLKILVDKIDSALLMREQIPDSAAAIDDFLKVFNPRLIPVNFSAHTVHTVVEEIRNFVGEIEEIIDLLKIRHRLEATEWWKQRGAEIESSLLELSNFRFSNTCLENVELTWNRVHLAVNRMIELSCAGLSYESEENSDAYHLVNQWQNTYDDYYQRISAHAHGLKSYANDEIELGGFLSPKCSNASFRYYQCHTGGDTQHLVKDTHGLLRSLLDEMIEIFEARAVMTEAKDPLLSVDFTAEEKRWNEEPATVTRSLKAINAGDYYDILFVDNISSPLDEAFAKLAGRFSELRRKNLINWRYETEEGINRFTLYVKASELAIDLDGYREEIKQRASNVSIYIPELDGLSVYRGLGPSGNITCLGFLPGELDLANRQKGIESGLVFDYQGQLIFASGKMHLDAAQVISDYLYYLHEENRANGRASNTPPFQREIYHKGNRVNFWRTDGTEVEKNRDMVKSESTKNALIELGILPQRIKITDRHFAPMA